MDITTLQRVKDYDRSVAGDTHDTVLAVLITHVSTLFERYMNRTFLTTSRSLELSVDRNGQQLFSLPAFPVTTITSVIYDTDRDFTDTNDILDSDYYRMETEDGSLLRIDGTTLSAGNRVLKVTYTGGMAADTEAFIAAYPEISGAADMQTAFQFKNAEFSNVLSQSVDGSTMQVNRNITLLPEVRNIVDFHTRRTF